MYDAIVLAGGSARRLGGIDKPALDVGGRSLLAHVVAAVAPAGHVVVVGPQRPLPVEDTGHVESRVEWCLEDPPGGGPVAAIAVGLRHTSADVVVVLAADLPWVAPAVPVLRAALEEHDVAVLVDGSGRVNHLAAAWRREALLTALSVLGDPNGRPVRALTSSVEAAQVPDPDGWGRDCDTWTEVDAARADPPR